MTTVPKSFTPTHEQEAIFSAVRESSESLFIVAYAGTGKTTTLERLAPLLKPPVLALAFNTDIAKTLRERLPPSFHVKTLNALGHQALSQTLRQRAKVDPQKLTKVLKDYTKGFSKDQWSDTREAVRLAMQAGLVPAGFSSVRGLVPDTPEGWEEALGYRPQEAVLEAARGALTRNIELVFSDGLVSFDDQLYCPLLFGGQWPKYPIVLCDEVQDFSPMNTLQLSKVAAGRIIAVGDPRQSIYAFRGASGTAVQDVKALREKWIELPLATTFRCPKAIVRRASAHAPGFRAAPTAPEGAIVDLRGLTWDITTLAPYSGPVAFLCRNNGPLMALSLKLLRKHQGFTFLGRDLAKGLKTLSRTVLGSNTPREKALEKIELWKTKELEGLTTPGDFAKAEAVRDRAEVLSVLMDSLESSFGLGPLLDKIFAQEQGKSHRWILSTAHKAKGLEWPTVVHLDPWRVPSKRALQSHDPVAIAQEYNTQYVLETRTKETLILADLKHFA